MSEQAPTSFETEFGILIKAAATLSPHQMRMRIRRVLHPFV